MTKNPSSPQSLAGHSAESTGLSPVRSETEIRLSNYGVHTPAEVHDDFFFYIY